MHEFSSPFGFRRGGVRKDIAAKQAVETGRILALGNEDRPGIDLPHCPPGQASAAARAFDEMCAKAPRLPPGRR